MTQDALEESSEFSEISDQALRSIQHRYLKKRYIEKKKYSKNAPVSIDRGGSGNVSRNDDFLPESSLEARHNLYKLF